MPLGQFPENPGEYMGPISGHTGDLPAVFFMKPNAHDPDSPRIARVIHHVVFPPHTYRECPDGSLEIRESLGDQHDGVSDGWHGYLDEGHIWRKC